MTSCAPLYPSVDIYISLWMEKKKFDFCLSVPSRPWTFNTLKNSRLAWGLDIKGVSLTIYLQKEFDKLHTHKEGAKSQKLCVRIYIYFSLTQRQEGREGIKHLYYQWRCSLNPSTIKEGWMLAVGENERTLRWAQEGVGKEAERWQKKTDGEGWRRNWKWVE